MKLHPLQSLTNAIQAKFVTLPDEELVFVQRKHWLVVAIPLVILSLLGIATWVLLVIASSFLISYFLILLPTALLLTLLCASFALRSFIDWYYNIYVITNRKILTISYSPLTSHKINEILLDQVKATEIDTKIDGIIDELLNIGHVIITFDRPTHEDALTLAYIRNPSKIESYLQNALFRSPSINKNPTQQKKLLQIPSFNLYNKDKHHLGKWTYTTYSENGIRGAST